MSRPFDATLKAMLEVGPGDWLVLAGYPPGETEAIDADISTVSGGADKVLRVRGTLDWIMHLEFQRGPDRSLPRRAHLYNAVLGNRHDLLVRSVLVLLSPGANLSNLTGVYQEQFAGEPAYLTFRYQVIRVWGLSAERLLEGGLGTLPLAPISATTEAELPGIIEKMKQRLDRTQPGSLAKDLWTAAYVLMGLRYERERIDQLLQGVVEMEESVTYQAILQKGRQEGRQEGAVQELHRVLLLQGKKRLGPADAQVLAAVEAIKDLAQLEQLSERLLEATSWQDLLDLPPGGTPGNGQGS